MRCTTLNLTVLEDRATPATFAYAAGTLTVTAETGDFLVVCAKRRKRARLPAGDDRPRRV